VPQLDRRLWQSLSPLLDQALDLDADARPAFLALLRSTDPALAVALENLLADPVGVLASDFLEAPAVTARDLAPSLAGQTIGAYTLECALGVGGMGTVWLARRSDGRFEGKVALKLVNLAVLDPVARERFAREGTVLARLAHPNIGRLFDAGVTAAGQPFLVLEYVNGTRIDEYADAHRLTVRARLELFAQAADAVAHAHANLIVHRDLKPSNILVDESGRVKLLDFGIAKLIEEDAASHGDARTVVTAQALTPRYAAPEQVSGGAVTTATDVYALGVLLYELLAGRHPTSRDEDTPAARVQALVAREPRRVSEAVRPLGPDAAAAARHAAARSTSVDRLQRACRGDLDIILAKALKKSPEERYVTVTAFADDVRRHLQGEAVAARRDSLLYRANRFVARHRLELFAAATAIVALVAGTAIAVVQARESARQRDRALVELRRAEATNDFSSFLLKQATPSGKPISNAELLARGEALIAKRFANDADLRVHMLLTLADRYQDNQQFDARARVLERAYQESHSVSDVGLRSFAVCERATQLAERGEFKQAFALFDRVMPVLSATPDYADYEARCRVTESIAANQANDGARAVAAAQRALTLEEQRRAAPGRELPPLFALGNAYSAAYRYASAHKVFARAAALLESEGLGNTRDMAELLNNWSAMLQEAGQMRDAVPIAERAVRIARAVDTEHGASLTMLSTMGNALTAVGNYPAAGRALDEAIAKARQAGSPRRLVFALYYAIQSACEAGDPERAERLLADAQRVLKADRSATAYAKGLIEVSEARVALASGDRQRAVVMAERALQTFRSLNPASGGRTQTFLARTLNLVGRFPEALGFADASVTTASGRVGNLPHSSWLGESLIEVATARAGLGDLPAARTALASALEHLYATVGHDSDAVHRAETLGRELEAR
jgi:serine/threonine protein kinase